MPLLSAAKVFSLLSIPITSYPADIDPAVIVNPTYP
jgi:hypothetical protein